MSKLFRPKTMRRMCVFLAMIAPAVYLFGSLFSALTGAHGTEVFANDSESQSDSLDVSYVTGYWIYGNGEIVSEAGGFLFDSVYVYYPYDGAYEFKVVPLDNLATIAVSFYSGGVFQSRSYSQSNLGLGISFDIPDGVDSFRVACVYSSGLIPSDFSYTLKVSYPSSDDEYFSAVGYSEYVFGQFFAKDNFLVEIGKDVLSDSPHGFVPFASFWKFLDTNMLHIGDMQLGLMAYGYMYYASHVLLFDVGFILVTFFLTFIQKVADKIGGEDHA